MIKLFIASLFSTFFVTRILTNKLHDKGGSNINEDKSKTLTGMIRRKTNIDIHHFHLGIAALLLSLVLIWIKDISSFLIFSLGVSISLIADDLTLFLRKELNYPSDRYFEKRIAFESFVLHVVIVIVAVIIFSIF